jgi:hypothetical protein
VIVLTLFFVLPAWSQPGSRFGKLEINTAKIEGDNLVLEAPVVIRENVKRVVIKKVDGKDVAVEEIVPVERIVMQTVKYPLKDVSAYGGDGKGISADKLPARLKEPTPVLVWGGGSRPRLVGETDWKDPPFRGLVRDDAIVLELPIRPIEPRKELPPEKRPQPIER